MHLYVRQATNIFRLRTSTRTQEIRAFLLART